MQFFILRDSKSNLLGGIWQVAQTFSQTEIKFNINEYSNLFRWV